MLGWRTGVQGSTSAGEGHVGLGRSAWLRVPWPSGHGRAHRLILPTLFWTGLSLTILLQCVLCCLCGPD